jgi:hypothetical protein
VNGAESCESWFFELAKRCFRPLSHLTNKPREYDEQWAIANDTLLIAEC